MKDSSVEESRIASFYYIPRIWFLKDAKFIHDGDVHFTTNPYTTEA